MARARIGKGTRTALGKLDRIADIMGLKRKNKIHIEGVHAEVRSLSRSEQRGFSGQPPLVKRISRERLVPGYTTAIGIAKLLYPKNFPKIVACDLKNRKIIYSERVFLGKRSQKGIEAADKPGGFRSKAFRKHARSIKEKARAEAVRIGEESGINVITILTNVGFSRRGKNLVFFEVGSINIPMLEERINSMSERRPGEKLRKKQAVLLLDMLKKEAKGKDIIYTHEW